MQPRKGEPRPPLTWQAHFDSLQHVHPMLALVWGTSPTVRMADRILVLEGGAIREDGTQHQLPAEGGTYAELFHLQATGYR
jgi:ABC-type bacteriocin/lantibiotic exporter with double-glycine peptidase domain